MSYDLLERDLKSRVDSSRFGPLRSHPRDIWNLSPEFGLFGVIVYAWYPTARLYERQSNS